MVRCLLFLLLLDPPLLAQPPLVLPGHLPASQVNLNPYTAFFNDVSGDTLPLAVIRQERFRPFSEKNNERTDSPPYSVLVTWLRFTLRNTHTTDTLKLLHQTGTHGLISLYEGSRLLSQTGIALPPQRRPSRFALALSLPPGVERTYFVRVVDYFWSPTPVGSELLTEPASVALEFGAGYVGERLLLAAIGMLMGCMLLMSLYAMYSFLLTHDRAFLYYALYTLAGVLFALHCMDYRFSFALLFPLRMSDVLSPFSLTLIAAFYTLFMGEIMALKTQFPRTWRLLRGLLMLVAVQVVFNVAEWIHARPFFFDYTVFDYVQMVPVGLITCVLLSTLLRSRSPIRYYLLAGLLSLVGIGFSWASLDIYVENGSAIADAFVNYPYFWIVLGLTVESFCFAMALAYRGRLSKLESRQIQEHHARDLATQLAQRTREVGEQARLLEAERLHQVEQSFEHKLAGTEMAALRSQMNPHFIFNCLNSIKLYTLENDSATASEFLTKFSRLIRLVLENSRLERVVLADELDALRLYIELEAMRYKDKLRYEIRVQPGLDPQYFDVPPLLLQPFVENAIWHGLMHKTEGGTVSLSLDQPDQAHVRVTVTDDGIGRAAAAALKSKSATRHKSFGMKVTSERIRLINQYFRSQTRVEINDLVDAEGQPAGTEVEIWIPV